MLVNKVIIVIILSVLFYVLIVLFSDFEEFSKQVQNVDFKFLPLILSLIFSSIIIKSLRQCFLLRKIGVTITIKESLKLFIAGLSMLITPGGSGELIKSQFLKNHYNYSRSKTVPYVFVERFHDLIAIVIIVLSSLVFIQSIESGILVTIAILLIVIIFLAINQRKLLKWFQSRIEKIKFLKRLFSKDKEFYDSLEILFKPKIVGLSLLFTIPSIFLEGLATYLGIISVIPNYDFVLSFQHVFSSVLAGLFSFLPAGLGVTEISLISFISSNEISWSQAATSVLYVRLTTLWFMTIMGFIILRTVFKKSLN